MVDDCDGKKLEVVGGITIKRRHSGVSSGLERGLGEEALLLDFLAKVLTKFNLIDRATEDSVAGRLQVQLACEGGLVRPAEGVKRSAFRCSMVVVFLCKCGCQRLSEAVGQNDMTSTRISLH
jgi:hypothetical protein